jgi:hypothetical protein
LDHALAFFNQQGKAPGEISVPLVGRGIGGKEMLFEAKEERELVVRREFGLAKSFLNRVGQRFATYLLHKGFQKAHPTRALIGQTKV